MALDRLGDVALAQEMHDGMRRPVGEVGWVALRRSLEAIVRMEGRHLEQSVCSRLGERRLHRGHEIEEGLEGLGGPRQDHEGGRRPVLAALQEGPRLAEYGVDGFGLGRGTVHEYPKLTRAPDRRRERAEVEADDGLVDPAYYPICDLPRRVHEGLVHGAS